MPFLQKAFIRHNPDAEDEDLQVLQKCVDQSCKCCYGYPAGDYQSVLINGVSDAIHLEFLAYPEVYICCPMFGNLKTLLLNEWCVANGLHGLVCILQHSPILEKLTLLLYNIEDFHSAVGDDGNHDPIEQTLACVHLKVVNIRFAVMNERTSKILKFLSTCGIPPEHIRLKVNHSDSYNFSFEMSEDTTPSTSEEDACTDRDVTTSSSDDD